MGFIDTTAKFSAVLLFFMVYLITNGFGRFGYHLKVFLGIE